MRISTRATPILQWNIFHFASMFQWARTPCHQRNPIGLLFHKARGTFYFWLSHFKLKMVILQALFGQCVNACKRKQVGRVIWSCSVAYPFKLSEDRKSVYLKFSHLVHWIFFQKRKIFVRTSIMQYLPKGSNSKKIWRAVFIENVQRNSPVIRRF